jgi:uncharacterized protein (DUF1778 family)
MAPAKEMAVTTPALKDERIELRVTRPAKILLQQAAAARNKTVSEFVVDSGLTAAAETLADRQHFALSEEQWNAFLAALDAPTMKAKPRLKKLLTTPSVLE